MSKLEECWQLVDRETGIYPLWMCPMRVPATPVRGLVNPTRDGEDMFVDVGMYVMLQCVAYCVGAPGFAYAVLLVAWCPQLRRAYYQIVPSHSLAQGHRGLGERRRRHSGETRAGVAEFFADHTVVAGGC